MIKKIKWLSFILLLASLWAFADNKSDAEFTRQLRERIQAEDQLSTRAKKIKITTLEKAIILEGPVAKKSEKIIIENLTRSMAGKKKVYNRLTY